MGFFNLIREANEDAHGTRLRQHLDDTLSRMVQLNDQVRGTALIRFVEKRQKLLGNISNMSEEGVLKMGRFLQSKAREFFDLNVAEGYALWLTGAWAESSQRKSAKAQGVYAQLDELAEGLSDELKDTPSEYDVSVNRPATFSTFDEWLGLFKYGAAQSNSSLKENDGSSLIDFMDHTPLRQAFADGVEPIALGKEFGRDFDLNNMI